MASEDFAVIQEFLDKVDLKDAAIKRAFGLSERNLELFVAALSAADEDLTIGDLTKVAKKSLSTKFPSAYINSVAKVRLIKRGAQKGRWVISPHAVDTMKKLLSGEVTGVEDVTARAHKSQKTSKRDSKPTSRARASKTSRKIPRGIANKTIGDMIHWLEARHEEIGDEIKKLEEERRAIPGKIEEIIRIFSE